MKEKSALLKEKVNEVKKKYEKAVVKRSFRISFYVIVVLLTIGSFFLVDYVISSSAGSIMLVQKISRSFQHQGYDRVELHTERTSFVVNEEFVGGEVWCYKNDEVVNKTPITSKMIEGFYTMVPGERFVTFVVYGFELELNYSVYSFLEAERSYLRNMKTEYEINEELCLTDALLVIETNVGTILQIPVEGDMVQGFTTEYEGEYKAKIVYQMDFENAVCDYDYYVNGENE